MRAGWRPERDHEVSSLAGAAGREHGAHRRAAGRGRDNTRGVAGRGRARQELGASVDEQLREATHQVFEENAGMDVSKMHMSRVGHTG